MKKEQHSHKEKKKELTRCDPFAGIKAQSERRAVGFDADKHRAVGVGTHLDKRSAGTDALLGERNYQKRLQQKSEVVPKGETHKETNYFVDRKGILYREVKMFDKKGEVVSTKVKRVKKGKVPKELQAEKEMALELQSTGGIASAPLGTRINIRKGDVSVNSNISGKDRQKLLDATKKTEEKAKEPKWYGNFLTNFFSKIFTKPIKPAEDFREKPARVREQK